jgi:dTDP-4-dehydrorhamnose 3,5-epimerase
VPEIATSERIEGVKIVTLTPFADERGRFLETFRKEWFPERPWNNVQGNRSDSKKGVLRGLHFHHHQIDYWTLLAGRVRVGLYDLRASSPTRGRGQMLEMTADEPRGVFIPVGVAHGFLALEDSTLTYVVDNYYDAGDEHGVAWNDREIGLDWGIEAPILSPRDRNNRPLAELDPGLLPL